MVEDSPLLLLDEVSYRYREAAPPVLDGVSLAVARGESLAIVGPSGCGKSTLLNLIGTLDKPTSGRIVLNGHDLSQTISETSLARIRQTQVGFVFQDHHLLPQCTLLENVLLATLAREDRDADAETLAKQLMVRVGLEDRMHHRPGEVSGGQRQRAAVVRAIINRPALLLADEPTGSLDQHSAGELGDLLVKLNADEGVGLIVVTHAQDLAKRMGRVYELCEGKLNESA